MDQARYRTIAGLSLIGAGSVSVLGFITAEALFPGYSTSGQTISALGAAEATPASQTVFNTAMVVSGIFTSVSAYGIHHVYGRRLLTGVLATTAVGGLIGVGLFPSQTGIPHFLAAMIAFFGLGLSALLVATTVDGPFRYTSAVLGVLELGALVLFVTLGDSTPLGIGGLERWVAYLGLVWATAFGGFLLPDRSGGG